MEKLGTADLIKISDMLCKEDLLVALLNMNNNGKLQQFMKLLGKQDILKQIINDSKTKKVK